MTRGLLFCIGVVLAMLVAILGPANVAHLIHEQLKQFHAQYHHLIGG